MRGGFANDVAHRGGGAAIGKAGRAAWWRRGLARFGAALLAAAALTPSVAQAQSSGCTAINLLDHTTSFNASGDVTSTTGLGSITSGSANMFRVARASDGQSQASDQQFSTNAYVNGGTVYTFTPGDVLTVNATLSNYTASGVTFFARIRTGTGTTTSTNTNNANSVGVTANGPGTPVTYTVTGNETAIGIFLTRNGGAVGTISASVTCTPASATPTITSVNPNFGSTAGGNSVSINGTNLSTVTGASGVRFGTTNATAYSISGGVITATAPAGTAGTTTVTVTNPSGSASSSYTYVAPPTLNAAFGTSSITVGGATTLTLSLTNPNAGTSLTGVSIATAAIPSQLTGSSPATTCTGGTAAYTGSAGGTLSLSGASLAGGASCTVTLTVTGNTAGGPLTYTTGAPAATGPTGLNGSSATTGSLTVAAAPTTPTITGNPNNPTNSTNATFTFTIGSGLTAQCQINGGGYSACISPQAYTGLPDGPQTFNVRSVNSIGDVSATPASFTWTVDTTAPPAPTVLTPANGSSTSSTTPTVTGTAEANSTVTIFINGGVVGTTTTTGAGTFSFTPPDPALLWYQLGQSARGRCGEQYLARFQLQLLHHRLAGLGAQSRDERDADPGAEFHPDRDRW